MASEPRNREETGGQHRDDDKIHREQDDEGGQHRDDDRIHREQAFSPPHIPGNPRFNSRLSMTSWSIRSGTFSAPNTR